MIKQFSVDIEINNKRIKNMDLFEIEHAINNALIIAGFKVRGVEWRATWNKCEYYEAGFGPDSSD